MTQNFVNKNGLVMDSTGHLEISIDRNEEYSGRLLDTIAAAYDADILDQLSKDGKKDELREKGKDQLLEIWKGGQSLKAHGDKYEVLTLHKEGTIIKKIRDTFVSESKFKKWRKKNFGHRHLRTLQEAAQIAEIDEEFIKKYASLGKNRILRLYRLKNKLNIELNELFERHPFLDTTADWDGRLFKEHCDGIETFYRFNAAGIKVSGFTDAVLYAAIKKDAVTKKEADELSKHLDTQKNKKKLFDNYLMNLAVLSRGNSTEDPKKESVDSILVNFLSTVQKVQLEDDDWIMRQNNPVTQENIVKAYQRLKTLALKLGLDLETMETKKSIQKEGDA